MSLSSDQLLTWLLLYGYPTLFGVVLLGSIGVPIPVNALVLAAGGFVATGELDLLPVVLVVLAAALLGDCLVYAVGRWAGEAAVHRHGARFGLGPARLAAVRARFTAWEGAAVFLTRWLLTPLAFPTSILAGASAYPALGFASYAALGEALWTGVYVGVGYVFGASWSGISDTVQDSAGLLAGLGIAALALALLWLLRRSQRRAAVSARSGARG
jgi:membrane protein DedA with SNARE-associated domain